MFSNHAYNLALQLTEEHKSLWRMKNEYQKDAEGCAACQSLWEKLAKDKEAHIQELQELLKGHME